MICDYIFMYSNFIEMNFMIMYHWNLSCFNIEYTVCNDSRKQQLWRTLILLLMLRFFLIKQRTWLRIQGSFTFSNLLCAPYLKRSYANQTRPIHVEWCECIFARQFQNWLCVSCMMWMYIHTTPPVLAVMCQIVASCECISTL